MDEEPNENECLEVLLAEYRELWMYIREYDKLIWQSPQYMGIVIGTLSIGAFRAEVPIRLLILIFALILSFILWIAAHKHNFFRKICFQEMENIAVIIKKVSGRKPVIREETSTYFCEINKCEREMDNPLLFSNMWPYKQVAYKWLFCSFYLVWILLSTLIICTTLEMYNLHIKFNIISSN